MYIDTMTAQNISGLSDISLGPGVTFKAINAPNKIAVVPDPGIPSVSKGTKDPVQAALLAVSGAAKPLIEPFPNSFCSFSEARLRSTAYPKNDAIVAPAPGKTPIKNPWIDCLPITGAI